jgi:ABC-type multidrug transport system fused ATPase/permease subunit
MMDQDSLKNTSAKLSVVLRLFTRRQILIMSMYAIIQAGFSVFDLFGVILIGVLTSLIVRDFANLSTGTFSSNLLDFLQLSDQQFFTQIAAISALALAFFIVKALLLIWTNKKLLDFFGNQSAHLSYKLFQLAQEIPFAQLDSITSQRLTFALTGGSTSIMIGVGATLLTMIADIALLVAIVLGLVYVDLLTTLCLFISSIVFFSLLQIPLGRKMSEYSEEQSEKIIQSQEMIHIMKNAYKELLVSGYSADIGRKFLSNRKRVGRTSSRIKLIPIFSRYALDIFFIVLIFELVLLQIATSDFARGVANLSIFLAALIRTTPAMVRLQQSLLTIKNNLATIEITFGVFAEISNVAQSGSWANKIRSMTRSQAKKVAEIPVTKFNPEVTLQKVSLSYSGEDFVLKDVNLRIPPNSKVFITGVSGSGKTSLLDLILGVHSPTSGFVEISGMSPRRAFENWPGNVMYLPQEVTFFKGSIRENILFPKMSGDVSDEQVWELLEEIELDQLVLGLPMGLDSNLGDRGNSLSGGQKQRIGLVRALLIQPKILILDEATNALDLAMERRLMNLVMRRMEGSTVIVVSHSDLDLADFKQVIEIENKQIQTRFLGGFN